MSNKRLLVDGSRGVYVPYSFINRYDPDDWGIPAEDEEVLRRDVDDWRYWDTWDYVLANAYHVDKYDVTWYLHQDEEGNLWAYKEYFDEAV